MENIQKIKRFILRKRFLVRVICLLVLIVAVALMKLAMWSSFHWESVTDGITNVYQRAAYIVGFCLVISAFSLAMWESVFPRIFPKYDRFVVSIVFLAVFCIFGFLAFVGFLDISVSFWLEDVKSFRFLVPLATLTFLGIFMKKAIFYDYDPWLVN